MTPYYSNFIFLLCRIALGVSRLVGVTTNEDRRNKWFMMYQAPLQKFKKITQIWYGRQTMVV